MKIIKNPKVAPGLAVLVTNKRQALAEAYGMGDIRVGVQITGEYPNAPAATVFKIKDS